jgi:hypothetical protein
MAPVIFATRSPRGQCRRPARFGCASAARQGADGQRTTESVKHRNLMTEKFNLSERHNVGDNVGPDSGRGWGMGDAEVGAALS